MNARQLIESMNELSLDAKGLALLLGVTTRAVSLWCAGDREVSGAAAAYINLLHSLPPALQAREISRINEENPIMYDGMYAVDYIGKEGQGVAALVFVDGVVFGHDGGVSYDGTYEPCLNDTQFMNVRLTLTVQPGVFLVQGVPPQPVEYNFPIKVRIPARQDFPLNIETPFGPIKVCLRFLRPLPQTLAA